MARISRSQSADEDVTDEDRSKASKAYSQVGISLYNDKGEYQDLNVTLDQLASKWDILTDAERNYIAEQSAGVRNINTFNAMMKTYGEAKELASSALSDTNFIDETQLKYMDSMEAKLSTLKATTQEFWNSLLDTGIINSGIELLTGIVNAGQNIIEVFGSVGSVFGETGRSLSTLAGTALTAYGIFQTFSKLKSADTLAGGFKDIFTSGKSMLSKIVNFGSSNKEITGGLTEGFANASKTMETTASSLTGKFSTLASTLGMSTTALAGFVGGFAALGIGIKLFDAFTNSTVETKEAVEELNKTYEENQSKLKSNKSTIDSISNEYTTLSQGIDSFGNNISLTSDQYDRYHEICNQIADIYPNLVSSFDAQGNAILNLKGNIEGLNEAYSQAVVEAARLATKDGSTYQENFDNAVGNKSWGTEQWDEFSDIGTPDVGGRLVVSDVTNELKKILAMNYDEFQEYSKNLKNNFSDIMLWLYDEDNFDIGAINSQEEWAKKLKEIPSLITSLEGDMDSAASGLKTQMQEWLKIYSLDKSVYPEFANLDDSVIAMAGNLISNTSTDLLKTLSNDGVEIQDYVYDILETLGNPDDIDAKYSLQNLLGINEDTSIEEMRTTIEDNLDSLADALKYDDAAELKVKLGLDDTDALINQYDELIEELNYKLQQEGLKAIEDLSHNEGLDPDLSMKNRVTIPGGSLKNSGWDVEENKEYSYNAKAYSASDFKLDGENSVVVTPILPTGEVLDPDTLANYANELLQGNEIDVDIKLATFDDDSTAKNADKFAKKLNKASDYANDLKNNQKRIKDYIRDNNINTADQLSLLNKCVQETDSWAEAIKAFELESIDVEANQKALNLLNDNLEVVEESIEKVNEAIEGSQSSMGMTREEIENVVAAFSGLDGYNYDKLFESTAEGVHLNVQELDRLNGEYKKFQQSKYSDTIDNLKQQYETLCVEIDKTSSSTERNKLINDKNTLEKQIKEAQELQSRYEGLTNAVTEWQRAKAGGEEGDTYVSIASDIENIEELYKKGLVGTREFKAAVQMMTNEDLSGAGTGAYIDTYKEKFAQFKSFFTEGGEGAENFLKKLQSIDKAWASQNKDGSWNIDADIEKMADSLGMSQSAITEIFKRLNDYGFDIDFREETDNLKGLREEAEKARDVLSDEYKLDLTVIGDDQIDEQITKGEKLIENLDETSDEYEKLQTQIDYLHAKAGETADVLNFNINYDDNKDELDEIVSRLKNIDNYKNLSFDWETTSVTNCSNQIDSVTKKLSELKDDSTGKVDLSAEGATDLIDVLNALINKKNNLETPAVIKLDKNDFEGDFQDVMSKLQSYQTALDEFKQKKYLADAGIDVDLNEAKTQLDNAISELNSGSKESKKIMTKLGLEPGSLTQEDINSALAGIDSSVMVKAGFTLTEEAKKTLGDTTADKTTKVKAEVDNSEVTALDANLKNARTYSIKTSVDKTKYNDFVTQIKDTTITQKIKTQMVGGSNVNGNANFLGNALSKGTAFAKGVWGAAKSGMSLVGELGREIIVRGNNWFTVGDNGAEFANIQKGDIIFNSKQSDEILNNGKVTSNGGRGKMAYASGTAYASGSYTTVGSLPGSNKFYNNYKSTKKKKEKEDDDFLETFDWIEIWLDRIERKVSELDTIANSAYKSFSKRNKTLAEEFSAVTEQISRNQQAYEAYIQTANSLGLSADYVNKIQNGTLRIEDITNEDLADKISQYQEFYEKALDCKDTLIELNETLGEISKAKFDNIASQYDSELSEIEHRINLIETGLDLVEAKGQFASKSYYETLTKNEQENINMIEASYNDLRNSFDEAMASNTIEEYSEEWYDMRQQINDIEEAYQDATLALIKYKNEMREMDWSIFEKGQDYISELDKESDFIKELLTLNQADLFDKNTGKLSTTGISVGGLHAMDYNIYMAQADEYRKKVQEINKELAKDPLNTTLIDKKNEYLDAQRESIENAKKEKEAIHDLIEDSYNKMLEILQKLIDKRLEALNAAKDLYSYEKNIKNLVGNIADLEKQMISISGDNSEEGKSNLQQLKDQLQSAKDDLEETEYDKYLSDQQALLEQLYTDYELVLNERLDNIDALVSEMIESTNASSEIINQTIKDTTSSVGYEITDGMKNIWESTDSGIGKVVSEYSKDFSTSITTTNGYIKSILDLMNKIVAKAEEEKQQNTNTINNSSSSGGSSGGSGGGSANNSSTSNSSNSSVNAGSFFVHKADSYPKSRLSINTSIVDRLKYRDIDSSFARRKSYYSAMGLSGNYTGSSSQNVAMLNWMKANGYKDGGTIGDLIKKSGEDGFVLARSGEEILSEAKLRHAAALQNNMIDFSKYALNTKNLGTPTNQTIENNPQININIEHVQDYDDLIHQIQNNPKFEKVVQDITLGKALGKNSMNKFKY